MARTAPQSAPRQRMPKNVGFTPAKQKRYLNFIGALGSVQVHGCILCRAEAEVCHVKFGEVCPICHGTLFWMEPSYFGSFIERDCLDCQGTGYRYGKLPNLRQHPWAINMCPNHHRLLKGCQHDGNEQEFWERLGIDILHVCSRLQDIERCSPSMPVALESAMVLLEDLR